MIFNIGNDGVSTYILTVSTASGATVTVTKNNKTYTAISNDSGIAVFEKITKGIWDVNVSIGSLTSTKIVNVVSDTFIEIIVNFVPDFTYSGSYAVYDSNDVDITNNPITQGDWKIKFFTSGVFKISKLNGIENGIDVFLVGGGANGAGGGTFGGYGGGGGYTKTVKKVSVSENEEYTITVGGASGSSSAFDNTANGGSGKNGGSGGGGQCANGGSNGSGGSSYPGSSAGGGTGQGSTTREFGEDSGKLYAGGGGGGACHSPSSYIGGGSGGEGGGGYGSGGLNSNAGNGADNTGGGGGGGSTNEEGTGSGKAGIGGSGIVIIRNAR